MTAWRRLGRSGLKIGPLGLGTANFGGVTDQATAHRMLDRALDAGVNLIDTANSYNHSLGDNRSEGIIGRWLAAGAGRRDRIVLCTKVFGNLGHGPNDGGLSAWHIQRACDDSLRRLNTDRIDIYHMHHVDRETPWEETLEALTRLIHQGKVLYIASSNFAAWQMVSVHLAALRGGAFGLLSEQSPYNLAQRSVELELLPACRHYGIGFLAYRPLGGGLLGTASTDFRRTPHEEVRDGRVSDGDRLKRFRRLCADRGLEPPKAALAWLLARPGVTAAVAGPRTPEQLELLLGAVDIVLDQESQTAFSALWPGPGEAPEAYAW